MGGGGVGGQEMNSLAFFMRLWNKDHERETSIATLRGCGDTSQAAYAVSGKTVLTEEACNGSAPPPPPEERPRGGPALPSAWPGLLK